MDQQGSWLRPSSWFHAENHRVISGIGWQLLTNRPLPPRFPALFHLVPFAVLGRNGGWRGGPCFRRVEPEPTKLLSRTNNPKMFVVENQQISFRTRVEILSRDHPYQSTCIYSTRKAFMDGFQIWLCWVLGKYMYVKFPEGGGESFCTDFILAKCYLYYTQNLDYNCVNICNSEEHCLLFHRVHCWWTSATSAGGFKF